MLLRSLQLKLISCLLLASQAAGAAAPFPQTSVQDAASKLQSDPVIGNAGILLLPGMSTYDTELKRYWNVQNQEIKPKIIVRPKTTQQAQAIVKLLSTFNIKFGVRSGGHMPTKGYAASNDVLISTTELNKEISYPNVDIIRIGPGLTWGEVYEPLLAKQRTAVGGRDYMVGVAGFLLGGGLSHLSNEYGLGIESIVSMEVITGKGDIVTASQSQNSDLFWALKGGGNNFGLVTRFDFRTIYQPNEIWGGIVSYDGQYLSQVLSALEDWQLNKQPLDQKAALELSMYRGSLLQSTNATFLSLVLYYGEKKANPAVFSKFLSIPNTRSTLRFTTHLDLAIEIDQGSTYTKRHQFYTGTFKTSLSVSQKAHDFFFDAMSASDFYNDPGTVAAITLQPIAKSIIQKNEGASPLFATLPSNGGPYVWYNFAYEYADSSLDTKIPTVASGIHTKIQQTAKAGNKQSGFLYLNDAGEGQAVIASYGNANVQKLRQVRSKYDPKLVFTNLCIGGYKI